MTERSQSSTRTAELRAGGANGTPAGGRLNGRPPADAQPGTLARAVTGPAGFPNGRVSATRAAAKAAGRTAVAGKAAGGTAAGRTAVAGKATRRKATGAGAAAERPGEMAAPTTGAGPKAAGKAAGAPRVGPGVAPRVGPGVGPSPARRPDIWDERVAGLLGFLRRRLTGQYEVDEFGFDPEFTETFVHPPLRLLYRRYFRVECTGVANLPRDGAALIVANHSGTVPVDALMLSMAVHDETPERRNLRLLGADLVFRVPLLSELARKAGSTLACNPDVERMLGHGELVGVFPEGFKGVGKPYRDRYRLQRFGRGGFVSAALRTGAPIIPASIVGAEEIYPIIGNIRPLARVTGLPYFPVTPLFPWLGPLGMVPLPSKWLIEFGEPIDTSHYGDERDDPIVVFNLADQVRETIQHTLHQLLLRRPDPFS